MDARAAFHEAQQRGILVIPVNDVSDLLEDEQLQQRGFFTPVEHQELGKTLIDAGAPYHHSFTPWRIRRAPLPGEHTCEVLASLGIGTEEIERLAEEGIIGRHEAGAHAGGPRG